MEILHNPRCAKSRETLKLIEEQGINPEIVLYLKDPLTTDKLKEVLLKLGVSAESIVRKSEVLYKKNYKGKVFNEDEWLTILTENPKLIERPIVIHGDEAIIGRPPGNVIKLF